MSALFTALSESPKLVVVQMALDWHDQLSALQVENARFKVPRTALPESPESPEPPGDPPSPTHSGQLAKIARLLLGRGLREFAEEIGLRPDSLANLERYGRASSTEWLIVVGALQRLQEERRIEHPGDL